MTSARILAALVLLGATGVHAQDQPGASAVPNACTLLSQADLEGLFPGASVAKAGENLSPLFRGTQYVANCLYRVDLGAATGATLKPYMSVAIVRWQGATSATNTPEEGMSELFSDLAAHEPALIEGIGDEAFALAAGPEAKVYVRRQDLIFLVSVDNKFDTAPETAAQIAALAGTHWGATAEKSADESAAAIAVAAAETPPSGPDVARWPDACELLPPADVQKVLPQAELVTSQALTGAIRQDSGEEITLPKPIGCWHTLRSGSGAAVVTNQVQLSLESVHDDAGQAAEYFAISTRVAGDTEPVEDVGDQAAIDPRNRIIVRQGNVVFQLRVTGGEADAALLKQGAEIAKAVARSIVARLAV